MIILIIDSLSITYIHQFKKENFKFQFLFFSKIFDSCWYKTLKEEQTTMLRNWIHKMF